MFLHFQRVALASANKSELCRYAAAIVQVKPRSNALGFKTGTQLYHNTCLPLHFIYYLAHRRMVENQLLFLTKQFAWIFYLIHLQLVSITFQYSLLTCRQYCFILSSSHPDTSCLNKHTSLLLSTCIDQKRCAQHFHVQLPGINLATLAILLHTKESLPFQLCKATATISIG